MEGRYFYSPKNAETDSTRILCDPYRFDIWHDVVKFSDSVVSLSEIDSHFPAVLENIRFAHLMERTLNHQKEILDNTKHAVHGNSQIVHNNNLLFKFDQLPIKDFLSLLPIVRPFSAIPNSQSLLKEISIKQLKKDFERDQVIINGCHMIGACSTIEGIISQMGEVLDRILINSHLSLLSSSTKNDVALLLLQLSSRTNSSGFAFEVLRQSIGLNQ